MEDGRGRRSSRAWVSVSPAKRHAGPPFSRHLFRAYARTDTRTAYGHKDLRTDTSEAVSHPFQHLSLPAELSDFIAMAAFLHRSCSSPSMEKSRQ